MAKYKVGDTLTTYKALNWSTRPGSGNLERRYFDFVVKDIKYGLISGEPYYCDDSGNRYGEDQCEKK